MALSSEQRAGLWRAKLRALARDNFGRDDGVDHEVPWGAALEHEGVWTALIEVSPARSFGQALVLAARNGAASLDVLIEGDAGAVARRAALFDPEPTVWAIEGTSLAAAQPSERAAIEPPQIAEHLAPLLDFEDIRLVAEHGWLTAECRGLEVARVHGEGADQRLEVGVGAYDQGAFAVMHPDLTPRESLAEVIAQVLTHRRRGAAPHPLNRLVRERWLRAELLDDPSSLGMASLEPVEPVDPRDGLRDVVAAPAIGTDLNGEQVLVMCSVGIDLDAVPSAVDLAEMHAADRIVLILPQRDQHPLVQAIADQSKRPIAMLTADEPWA